MLNNQDTVGQISKGSLAVFKFESRTVRVVTDNKGEPWFVAADVCSALTIANSSDAVSRLDDDEKMTIGHPESRPGQGAQELNIINESGLYSLVFASRKPETKRFKKWVTGEVLPSIRKTGSYLAQPEQGYYIPQTYVEALKLAADLEEKRQIAETKLLEAQPKIEYHDAVHDAVDCHSFIDAAKILGWGRTKLMKKLREIKVLMSDLGRKNLPYQLYIDKDYFRVTQSYSINQHTRETFLNSTTVVTGKGMIWLAKTLAKDGVK